MNAYETVIDAVNAASRIAEYFKRCDKSLEYWSPFKDRNASGILCCKSGHLNLKLETPIITQPVIEALQKDLREFNLTIDKNALCVNSKKEVGILNGTAWVPELTNVSIKYEAFKLLCILIFEQSKSLNANKEHIAALGHEVWLTLDKALIEGEKNHTINRELLTLHVEIKIPQAEVFFFKYFREAKRREKLLNICDETLQTLYRESPTKSYITF